VALSRESDQQQDSGLESRQQKGDALGYKIPSLRELSSGPSRDVCMLVVRVLCRMMWRTGGVACKVAVMPGQDRAKQ